MPNEGSYDAALERSNRVHEDLKVNPGKYTMLTCATTSARWLTACACRRWASTPTSSSPTTR